MNFIFQDDCTKPQALPAGSRKEKTSDGMSMPQAGPRSPRQVLKSFCWVERGRDGGIPPEEGGGRDRKELQTDGH